MKIDSIVKDILLKHEGGEIFFDALDNEIRKDNNLLAFFFHSMVEPMLRYGIIDSIIVSGRFGRVFMNSPMYGDSVYRHNCNVICVNGGLRKNGDVEDFVTTKFKKFIFLDDSFYSGETRNKISTKLDEYSCCLVRSFVIYDGSVDYDVSVESLYRYYKTKLVAEKVEGGIILKGVKIND